MVSEKCLQLGTARSCIRELFEYGLRQAAVVGSENVYDYSLGNPSIPAPAEVNETFISIVRDMDSLAVHSYTPATGGMEARKAVAEDLNHRIHTVENFALGARRFCVGLAKKVLLANSIGALWDAQLAAQSAGELTVLGGWMGLFAFGFQISFDFSGYSDMAIGLGQIFGFRFNENFDYPYLSASVTEFWRRWHMSLTSWFREYLYIPLGGNRGGTAKTLRNILIVWFCTGFWHGASWNFILWGLYFAAWLIVEKYVLKNVLARTPAWAKHLYTILVVFVGWGIFAMEDLAVCGAYLADCFGGAPLWSALDGYRLRSYAVTFLVLIVASTTLGKTVWGRLPEKARKVLTPVLMALSLVVCTAYLVDGSYNPFLYFRF